MYKTLIETWKMKKCIFVFLNNFKSIWIRVQLGELFFDTISTLNFGGKIAMKHTSHGHYYLLCIGKKFRLKLFSDLFDIFWFMQQQSHHKSIRVKSLNALRFLLKNVDKLRATKGERKNGWKRKKEKWSFWKSPQKMFEICSFHSKICNLILEVLLSLRKQEITQILGNYQIWILKQHVKRSEYYKIQMDMFICFKVSNSLKFRLKLPLYYFWTKFNLFGILAVFICFWKERTGFQIFVWEICPNFAYSKKVPYGIIKKF